MSDYQWQVFEGLNLIAHEDYPNPYLIVTPNTPRFRTLTMAKRWLARRGRRNVADKNPRYWRDGP